MKRQTATRELRRNSMNGTPLPDNGHTATLYASLTVDERAFIVNIMGQIQVNAGDPDSEKVCGLVKSITTKLAPIDKNKS